jgi:hypothetical protein
MRSSAHHTWKKELPRTTNNPSVVSGTGRSGPKLSAGSVTRQAPFRSLAGWWRASFLALSHRPVRQQAAEHQIALQRKSVSSAAYRLVDEGCG